MNNLINGASVKTNIQFIRTSGKIIFLRHPVMLITRVLSY